MAAARRTQSSFSTYLASTNPSDLGISVFGGASNGGGTPPNYSRGAVEAIAHLPGVSHVEAGVPLAAAPLSRGDAPDARHVNDIQPVASVDGLYFGQDRLAVVSGRMADPTRHGEVVMTPLAAHLLGVHVGERIRYGIYDLQQENEPGFGTSRVAAPSTPGCHPGRAGAGEQLRRPGRHRPLPDLRVLHAGLGREIVADGGQGWQGPSSTVSNSTGGQPGAPRWNGSSRRWPRRETPSASTAPRPSRSRSTAH